MPQPNSNSRSIRDGESHAEAQRRGGIGISRSSLRPQRLFVSLFLIVVFAWPARADIFQWEYTNPADPSQGKRQSTTLAPDGAGVDAVPGAFLANRNLTMAYLIGADLADAEGSFTNLANADLSRANLTRAHLFAATLSNADFTNAVIQGANLDYSGITPAQIYSSASYQAGDLSGVTLRYNDLSGANFARQNLNNVDFSAVKLVGANFREASLANARFVVIEQCCVTFPGFPAGHHPVFATLTGADLTAADARGAIIWLTNENAAAANLIRPDGHVDRLELNAGDELVVRDYDGDPTRTSAPFSAPFGALAPLQAVPITVDQRLAVEAGGTLRMIFEADAWDSTISFAPGIPVTLGGKLALTFADTGNLANQIDRTFDLFDWTGVNPTGAFAVSSPYTWDLSNLYTTGEVTLISVPEPVSGLHVTAGLSVLVIPCRRRSFKRFLTVEIRSRTHAGEHE
jgi:uncharacterized protein YjbI with pentapeptide repeats